MRWSTPVLVGTAVVLVVGLGSYMLANPPEALKPSWKGGDILGSAQGTITRDNPLEVSARIPNGSGMFFVEIIDHVEDVQISARVTGPIHTVAASALIDTPAYMGVFKVHETYWHQCDDSGMCPFGGVGGDTKGFTLTVESDSTDPVNVVAMLGQGGTSTWGAQP